MRTGKGNQEEEDYGGEEDLGSKREDASSASRDAKENDKASAVRSKHSVTEQRRRSKINERFQVLRELIPTSEQKRDTASFLLEVIDYVQYLQEKVQKYEGSSYPGWSQEPTNLTPWRNNHWRVESLANHQVAVNNGSVPVVPFPGKFEENNTIIASARATVAAELQNPVESEKGRPMTSKLIDSQAVLDDKRLPVHPLVHVEQSSNNECPAAGHGLGLSDDLVIEGGTISISTIYSHELLSSLTQALQNAGIDLSHAKLSVQIDLGKRVNPSNKNPLSSHIEGATRSRNPSVEEDSEHSHKRMKRQSHFSLPPKYCGI